MKFILASGSPRRREMLAHLGVDFTVVTSLADENIAACDPCTMVEELARRKALAVLHALPATDEKTILISADTVVVSPDGTVLGKPRDRSDARAMLKSLSDRTHRVISGICVCDTDGTLASAHEITEVTFDALTPAIIDAYVDSGECDDKAGAYGIQDTAALWIRGIRGDYFNVVGLPIHRLERLLHDTFDVSLYSKL